MTGTLRERPGLPGSTGHGVPAAPPGLVSAYPGYAGTALLDRLRATGYADLDAGGHVYTYRDRVVGTEGLPPRRGC